MTEENVHSLLKFITCGSVDDGKSTLIGHILYDSKLLYADQVRALELESKVGSRGGQIDYSLLLDGLMAEREQGITIDVAYRYFTTDRRSFIVADTPGHEEYTRNMAVGASFAELAVILIDATKGVLVQTRRHARICALMGIRYFVFAVNKMDLAAYSEQRFNEIVTEINALAAELLLPNVISIPLSATEGDNVTQRSEKLSWYNGPALLSYLENVEIRDARAEEGFVLPVQRVCRPNAAFRGFEGQIESGAVSVGDEVTSLPSGEKAHVKRIITGFDDKQTAFLGQAVTLQLDREVDVSRGCVLAALTKLRCVKELDATVLWMDDSPLTPGEDFFIKLGTALMTGTVKNIGYRTDVNTGTQLRTDRLQKNEIGLVLLEFAGIVVADVFKRHKALGGLIFIDRVTNMTSGCGIVEQLYDPGQIRAGGNDELRALIVRQRGGVFRVDAACYDKKFVHNVESVLLHDGHLVYLFDDLRGGAQTAVPHLVRSGVAVLLYAREAYAGACDIAENVKFDEPDQAAAFIVRNL